MANDEAAAHAGVRMMKITILDDYFDTLRHLPCFAILAGQDVTVFTDHVQDDDVLAERLEDAEVLVLIRERTRIASGEWLRSRWALTWLMPIRPMALMPKTMPNWLAGI